MKNFRKAGLLIITLVIPALVFAFLKFFGTNHYNVPYYNPKLNPAGDVLVNGRDTSYNQVLELGLDSVEGVQSSSINLRDKLTVISFLPEVVDDSTELMLAQLDRVYSLSGKIKNLQLVTFASDDPSKSISEKIGQPGWMLLVGARKVLLNILNEKVKFQTNIPKAKTNSPESRLVLVDRNGFTRGYYNGFDPDEIDRLMAEIKILDYEKNLVNQP